MKGASKGFSTALCGVIQGHPSIDTVHLNSIIVKQENTNKPEKHLMFLHGLFGNATTFRYLAVNKEVIGFQMCHSNLGEVKKDESSAGCEKPWIVWVSSRDGLPCKIREI